MVARRASGRVQPAIIDGDPLADDRNGRTLAQEVVDTLREPLLVLAK